MEHIDQNMFNPTPFEKFTPDPTKAKNTQLFWLMLLMLGAICFAGWYLNEKKKEEQQDPKGEKYN